ncbi:MAG TPA: DUF6458 family protein [Aeromicrobium sp.]|nr:DUF6458 family protein [Aeromicrobium sp.]
MGIGTGIVLIALGLVLLLGVVQVDIPWIEDYTLGLILTALGVLSLVLVMILASRRRHTT